MYVMLVAGFSWSGPAIAFEPAGAWTTDADRCNQVFVQNKDTNRLDFANAQSRRTSIPI